MNRYLSLVLVSLFVLISHVEEVKADSDINFNASVGLGLRYSGWTFPFPLVNLNAKLGSGVVFVEGSASIMAFIATAGYEYKLTNNSSIYLAKNTGFTINSEISGYKVGYIYNSNEFNKRGWVTSIELYRFDESIGNDGSFGGSMAGKNIKLIPSISFGYQFL